VQGGCASLLVAEEDGQIVGAGVIAYDGWRAFLYHVAVAANQRRRGIGSALMAAGEEQLMARGARAIFAIVKEDMTDGIALLGASSYEAEGEVVFVKTLA
jgi:ribosomal protein S18 acetylase RimI-like enzyme